MNANTLFTFLATNLLWQTALIGAAVYGALKLLPRAHASTRYRIALGGLLGCVLLLAAPFLPSLSPDLAIGVTAETVIPLQDQASHYVKGVSPTDDADVIISTVSPQALNQASGFIRPILPTLLTALWGLGSIIFLFRILLAIWHGRAWIKQAQTVRFSKGKLLITDCQDFTKLTCLRTTCPWIYASRYSCTKRLQP